VGSLDALEAALSQHFPVDQGKPKASAKSAHRVGLTPDPARDLGSGLLDLAGCGLDRLPGLGDTHNDFPMHTEMGIRWPPGDSLPQRRACAYPGPPYLTEETR
jgi:hypothetical protein